MPMKVNRYRVRPIHVEPSRRWSAGWRNARSSTYWHCPTAKACVVDGVGCRSPDINPVISGRRSNLQFDHNLAAHPDAVANPVILVDRVAVVRYPAVGRRHAQALADKAQVADGELFRRSLPCNAALECGQEVHDYSGDTGQRIASKRQCSYALTHAPRGSMDA